MTSAAIRIHDPARVDDAEPLTREQETLIGYRYGLVQDWRSMCRTLANVGVSKAVATREFLARHPGVSQRTLYRWDKLLRDDLRLPPEQRQGLRVLLDRRSSRARSAAPEENYEQAWTYFRRLYFATPPQTITTCWHLTQYEAQQQGWHWPSLRTIQARVAEPEFQIFACYFREGEKEWMRRYGHKIPRDLDAYRAGEWIMSDFHVCDVFCRRSETDPRIVRPLIAATMDIRSRVVHFHVCTSENQREVLASLVGYIKAFGVPNHWTIDNGKPYRSLGISGGRPTNRRVENEDYVRSVAGQLGIAVHFSIAHNPNGKTYLERCFGTLETQLRPVGWCGHAQDDVFREASRLAQHHPERCLTVDQYAALVAKWVERYHATPHGGECMADEHGRRLSPLQAFAAFDPIPMAVAPAEMLDRLTMLTAKARVTSMGVLYKGLRYGNYEGLFDYMGQDVMLRIPPGDAGRVIVCDIRTGAFICEAVNRRLQISGVDHDHVAEGMRKKRAARRLMKQVRRTDLHAAMRSVEESALAERAQEVIRASADRQAATGTHDAAPAAARNVRPLRPDLMGRLVSQSQAVPVAPSAPPRDLLAELAAQAGADAPTTRQRDLLEVLHGPMDPAG